MGDKLNEIRRKMSRLRTEMLSLQEDTRVLVNHGLDCSEPSRRLMAMRVALLDLIARRNAIGGIEVCPTIAERLKQNHRREWQHRSGPGKAKPGRSRALPI